MRRLALARKGKIKMTDRGDSWPEHIDYALARLGDPNQAGMEQVVLFAQRWGGLDLAACIRAWDSGDEHDKLFALLALSHLDAEPARLTVHQALKSERPKERWISAIGLGEVGDKQALPGLCTMLTEFLPEQVDEHPRGQNSFYFVFRGYAPEIIGRMGEPLATPALRQALERMVDLLRQRSVKSIETLPDPNPYIRDYISYEGNIVYALGRLGAFGALTGLPVVESWLRLWTLHLVMGHLHGAYPWQDMVRWRYHPELEMDIRHTLMFQFGLALDEQHALLDYYERTKLRELDTIYELELAREHGDLKW